MGFDYHAATQRWLAGMGGCMTDMVIACLDKARIALAQATTIQQAKLIMDQAAAAEVYATRQGMGEELIGFAHEVKIEALAELGLMLEATPRNTGSAGRPGPGRGKKNAVTDVNSVLVKPPTYAELGLDRRTAMIAQRLASLPPEIRKEIAKRVKSLTEALRLQRREDVKAAPPLPDKIYSTFLADPPWWYGDSRLKLKGATGASAHYESMTIEQLCLLERGAVFMGDQSLTCRMLAGDRGLGL